MVNKPEPNAEWAIKEPEDDFWSAIKSLPLTPKRAGLRAGGFVGFTYLHHVIDQEIKVLFTIFVFLPQVCR
jgi:hypothetical protein